MKASNLGKVYEDGEVVVRQGEEGDCMYVIQAGQAEVVQQEGSNYISLAILDEGDFFGEMALVDREVRSATCELWGRLEFLL